MVVSSGSDGMVQLVVVVVVSVQEVMMVLVFGPVGGVYGSGGSVNSGGGGGGDDAAVVRLMVLRHSFESYRTGSPEIYFLKRLDERVSGRSWTAGGTGGLPAGLAARSPSPGVCVPGTGPCPSYGSPRLSRYTYVVGHEARVSSRRQNEAQKVHRLR